MSRHLRHALAPYPHAAGCDQCRTDFLCDVCGVSVKPGQRCTNGRCLACHAAVCTPGGETSPWHDYGTRAAAEKAARARGHGVIRPDSARRVALQLAREALEALAAEVEARRRDSIQDGTEFSDGMRAAYGAVLAVIRRHSKPRARAEWEEAAQVRNQDADSARDARATGPDPRLTVPGGGEAVTFLTPEEKAELRNISDESWSFGCGATHVQVLALLDEIDALRADFERYAEHYLSEQGMPCRARHDLTAPCTCGLDEARRRWSKEKA